MELKNRRHSLSEANQVFGHLIIEVELDGSNLIPVVSRSKGPEFHNVSLGKKNRILSLMVCFLIPFPAESRDPWCCRCTEEGIRNQLKRRNWRTAGVH